MYYPIQLDKVRNFRYGMRAISLIEKKFKKSISSIKLDELTMEETAVFIWAGFYHEDKELTPDKVMDLVDDYSSMKEITALMLKAMKQSFGAEEMTPSDNGESEKNALEVVEAHLA